MLAENLSSLRTSIGSLQRIKSESDLYTGRKTGQFRRNEFFPNVKIMQPSSPRLYYGNLNDDLDVVKMEGRYFVERNPSGPHIWVKKDDGLCEYTEKKSNHPKKSIYSDFENFENYHNVEKQEHLSESDVWIVDETSYAIFPREDGLVKLDSELNIPPRIIKASFSDKVRAFFSQLLHCILCFPKPKNVEIRKEAKGETEFESSNNQASTDSKTFVASECTPFSTGGSDVGGNRGEVIFTGASNFPKEEVEVEIERNLIESEENNNSNFSNFETDIDSPINLGMDIMEMVAETPAEDVAGQIECLDVREKDLEAREEYLVGVEKILDARKIELEGLSNRFNFEIKNLNEEKLKFDLEISNKNELFDKKAKNLKTLEGNLVVKEQELKKVEDVLAYKELVLALDQSVLDAKKIDLILKEPQATIQDYWKNAYANIQSIIEGYDDRLKKNSNKKDDVKTVHLIQGLLSINNQLVNLLIPPIKNWSVPGKV